MEIWKDIPNYVGNYQCSSYGRVKSLSRSKRNGKGYIKILTKVLNPTLSSNGYYKVGLYKSGKAITYKVGILVAMTFLNHKPNGHTIIVDHIDNNPLNDRLDNLQIITHRENCSKDKWRCNPSSKYPGVCWYKRDKKWLASIRINGKKKHLGYFIDELEAHNACKEALKPIL